MKKSIILIVFISITVLLSGCYVQITPGSESESGSADEYTAATVARFKELEVRNYKGARLDPAVGPSDNSIIGVQEVDIENYSLKVDGLVKTDLEFSYDDVIAMESSEKLITLYCVTGWDATILWKGVLITALIDMDNVMDAATIVVFHCVDGYTTSMPLQTILNKKMILAYSTNGITLPPELGFPFIVVAEDKLGYKWARWVTRIELSGNTDYVGYWEGHGYGNIADVPDSRK